MTSRFVTPSLLFLTNGAFEDKGVNEMVTPSGIHKGVFINESGLNALIMGSTHEAVNKHVDEDDSVKRGLIDSLGDLCERG